MTLSGKGWCVLSNFTNFSLSEHGVHLKILQTPRVLDQFDTCTAARYNGKNYYGSDNSALA